MGCPWPIWFLILILRSNVCLLSKWNCGKWTSQRVVSGLGMRMDLLLLHRHPSSQPFHRGSLQNLACVLFCLILEVEHEVYLNLHRIFSRSISVNVAKWPLRSRTVHQICRREQRIRLRMTASRTQIKTKARMYRWESVWVGMLVESTWTRNMPTSLKLHGPWVLRNFGAFEGAQLFLFLFRSNLCQCTLQHAGGHWFRERSWWWRAWYGNVEALLPRVFFGVSHSEVICVRSL